MNNADQLPYAKRPKGMAGKNNISPSNFINAKYRVFYCLWFIQSGYIATQTVSLADSALSHAFAITAAILQGAFLSVPVALFCRYVDTKSRHRNLLLNLTACISLLVLVSNYRLYAMYGFFFNDFVFNIVSTAGGVSALGATPSMWFTFLLLSLAVYLLLFVLNRFVPTELLFQKISRTTLIAVLITATLLQTSVFAFAEYRSWNTILHISDKTAWYIPVTSKGIFKQLGVERKRQVAEYDHKSTGKLNYPPQGVGLDIANNYNIVWLVAESWRWDMLNPKIMPNTSSFANDSQRFMHHYSSGNGTRMGMFGMFYGIYGSYWFDFLRSQKAPVLLHALKQVGYDMQAYTSAKFTYPEFDKTIFSEFPKDKLFSDNDGQAWERDQNNVTKMIRFMDQAKQHKTPFFSFMFFEATHANYTFPPESIINPDYLQNLDYVSTDFAKNIDGIKARYENSSYYLDLQFARVFDYLRENKLLENTIVIVTGDHGEEFMENGYWGHNSTFSEQQTRVPLVVHYPNAQPAQHDQLSSHLDIPATVMHLLGNEANSSTYSFGSNLLAENYRRDSVVISDWHGNALITNDYKLVLSSKGRKHGNRISTKDDKALAKLPAGSSEVLRKFLATLPRFND